MRAKNNPNLAAKAELVAKASYSRKRITREEIPSDVTRAKAGAWLDLISPLTEWAGLKGDELRHKREQLRLQREDVLAKIAQQCTERLRVRPATAVPVPNKFLVPFLEQASLESPDSTLVDMWANLFVSASEKFEPYHTHFVGVISHIAPGQGEIFRKIVAADDLLQLEFGLDDIDLYYRAESIRHHVRQEAKRVQESEASGGADEWSGDDFCNFIYDLMAISGISVVHGAAENTKTGEYFDIEFDYMHYKDENEVDYSILKALGLIDYVHTDFFDVGKWSLVLMYYHVTRLGFYFTKACEIIKKHGGSALV